MDSFPEHLRSGYEPRNWEGIARAQARFIWAEASSGDPSFYLLPPLPLLQSNRKITTQEFQSWKTRAFIAEAEEDFLKIHFNKKWKV